MNVFIVLSPYVRDEVVGGGTFSKASMSDAACRKKDFIADLWEWNLLWEEFNDISVTYGTCFGYETLEASVMLNDWAYVPSFDTMFTPRFPFVWF